tara:strand:+ start:229 stop:555 length:327 start_codon:yes stop_codon:yes gene_type:complete
MADTGSSTFTYSDAEFMCVFNHILTNENIAEPVVDINAVLPSAEYDSLELVMLFGWLSEMFNINFDSVDVDTLLFKKDVTLKELKDLVAETATTNLSFSDLASYSICQ